MIFIFLVCQDKHEILKHMRKDGKPKSNVSDIPFQYFQEKTPPQNSETKEQFSLYQQLWDRVNKSILSVFHWDPGMREGSCTLACWDSSSYLKSTKVIETNEFFIVLTISPHKENTLHRKKSSCKIIKLQVFSIPQFTDDAKTKRKKNRILISTGNINVSIKEMFA